MASWRDGVTPSVQEQMDELLGRGLDLGLGQVGADSSVPFAVVLTGRGDFEARGAEADDVLGALDELRAGLRSERSALQGAALVWEVKAPSGGDGLQVHIEHADPTAPALLLLMPFARGRNGVEPGVLSAARGVAEIWP